VISCVHVAGLPVHEKEEFTAALAEVHEAEHVVSTGGVQIAPAVPGTVVPERRRGLEPTVLAPDYQRIIGALDAVAREATGPLNCRQIAASLRWETSAAGVERVRAKARRIVERFLAHLMRSRRLARDFERRTTSAEAMVYWSMILLMTRRLARPRPSRA